MGKHIKYWWYKFHSNHLQKIKLKFVSWWDSKNIGTYCWADCVSWAFSPTQWNPFTIGKSDGCRIESITHEHESCYCGQWSKGICFCALPKSEQERIIAERHSDNTELPF